MIELNKINEEGMQLKSFDDVVNIVSDKFKVNPFFIDSNKKKGVLICADEFSLLTENAWTTQQQKDFLNLIHNEKLLSIHFVNFNLRASKATWSPYSLIPLPSGLLL